jgi:5'-nucleotidase
MQGKRRALRAAGLALAALAALAIAVPSADAQGRHGHHHHHKAKNVDVQLLGINDFHGNLEPPAGSSGRVGTIPAGGAAYLATHLRELRQGHKNTLTVAAGDLIGASPLLSALFHDEPTIEAMNDMGLQIASVGNHEFDEGATELLRMQNGGCHPTDGCQGGHTFQGADFRYLSANVVDRQTGKPLFPPYAIRKFNGVKIGFIGMTLEGTPLIVTPTGIANLKFLDEADTANKYAKELHRKGVDAVVVLLHEGGVPSDPLGPTTINGCTNLAGPITDIVNRTTQRVDLFMTAHTHQAYNCVIDGRPVTSASSFGRLITDVDLRISKRTHDVTQVMADNKIVTQDVPQAADVSDLIAHYKTISAPLENRVIGRSTAPIVHAQDPDGESPAGNLIADSQQAATASPDTGSAVAAFMNPGGVRSDFPGGDITYGAAFTVQPFGNNLTTITLTGAQIWTMLDQQWCGQTSGAKILQPSSSVKYTWSAARAAGDPCANNPVTALTIGGQAVPNDASQSYRITVNSFLADGGDGFGILPSGTNRVGGAVDLDAVVDYLAPTLTGAPIAPPALDRITMVG